MDSFSLHEPLGWRTRLLFTIPLLLLIAACGRATSTPPQVTAPVGQTGTFKPGDTTRSMVYAGIERKYVLHIPAGYDAARPTPLVLAFHGIGLNAEEMIRISRLNEQVGQVRFHRRLSERHGRDPVMEWWALLRRGGAKKCGRCRIHPRAHRRIGKINQH